MKTDDIVYYDDSRGIVVSAWPSRRPKPDGVGGRDVLVYWTETGAQTVVWESDLLTEAEHHG